MTNPYDQHYERPGYYWGKKPSAACFQVLELLPPDRPLRLLDIGCGEGRNAIFFARNGYQVTAFDSSPSGIKKTKQLAEEAGVSIEASVGNLLELRLSEPFDVLFSTGALHYIPLELRDEVFENYRRFTNSGGCMCFRCLSGSRSLLQHRMPSARRICGCRVSCLCTTGTGRLSTVRRRFLIVCRAGYRTSTQ